MARRIGRDSSTTELASGCRSGDADAWEELLERYQTMVFSTASSEGLSAEDAADVTQHAFEELMVQLDRIRNDEQIPSWLITVAKRQSWRVRNDRLRQITDEATTIGADETTTDPISDTNTLIWLSEGLALLDLRCRQLIRALYFESGSPSYAEIASRLGRPVGSIGPTRARCLERLRKLLGDRTWDD